MIKRPVKHDETKTIKLTGFLCRFFYFIAGRLGRAVKHSCFLLAIFIATLSFAETLVGGYSLDQWADAIFLSEGGYKATFLYGIRSIKYIDEADARQICKNTVYNTLVKYRKERCYEGEEDISCLARRYCPIGASNDRRNLNKNWKKNVLFYLEKDK